MTEVSQRAEAQSQGVSQIHLGVEEISRATQQSAATTEEAASSAMVLSDQARTMKELVGAFKLAKSETEMLRPSNTRQATRRPEGMGRSGLPH